VKDEFEQEETDLSGETGESRTHVPGSPIDMCEQIPSCDHLMQ